MTTQIDELIAKLEVAKEVDLRSPMLRREFLSAAFGVPPDHIAWRTGDGGGVEWRVYADTIPTSSASPSLFICDPHPFDSIDVALRLVPEGAGWNVHCNPGLMPNAAVGFFPQMQSAHARTPAIALVIASLKAIHSAKGEA